MIKFNYTDHTKHDPAAIEYTINTEPSLDEVLDHFLRFLKSVGYNFPIGAFLTVETEEPIAVNHKVTASGCADMAAQENINEQFK